MNTFPLSVSEKRKSKIYQVKQGIMRHDFTHKIRKWGASDISHYAQVSHLCLDMSGLSLTVLSNIIIRNKQRQLFWCHKIISRDAMCKKEYNLLVNKKKIENNKKNYLNFQNIRGRMRVEERLAESPEPRLPFAMYKYLQCKRRRWSSSTVQSRIKTTHKIKTNTLSMNKWKAQKGGNFVCDTYTY